MARINPAGMYRRIATLFTVAFLIGLVVLALLGHFGLPEALLGPILGGATLITFAAIGANAGTLDLSEFQLAGRAVSAEANGMASAAAALGGAIYLGLAGVYLADPWTGAAVTAGWVLGCVGLAVGVAPYLRKSGAFGIADFLGLRYRSRLIRLAAVVVVVAALTGALGAALVTAAYVAALFFNIGLATALAIVTAVVLLSTVLGGMRAITLTAIIQYIVLAVAFVIPVAIASAREFFVPLPQFTFGLAFDHALLLAEATGDDLAAPLAGSFLPLSAGTGADLIATVLCLAAGVAILPQLALRTAAVTRVGDTRRSAGWMLFFILVVALAAPAYAAFAELTAMRDLVGTGFEVLPDWVFAYGGLGWLQVCGVDAASPVAAIEACRTAPDFTGNLAAGDLALGGDMVVLGGPAILGLPYVTTALIAAGALAATLAATNALAFTIASAIGNDLSGSAMGSRSSASRQLIVTRVLLVLVILAGAWLAANRAADALGLAIAGISLSAGGLFPAVILGIWWKRASAAGALAGILAGGIVTAAVILERRYPGLLPLGAINPANLGLTELTAALAGIPVGFAAIVGVSYASAAPGPEADALVDAIRRPGGTPFIHESES